MSDILSVGVPLYVVLLISLVVHEAAHATVALLGGDRTAYLGGQVTLNPIPHIQREPFGTVVLPILVIVLSLSAGSIWCMGYASTPIDPVWAYRHPKRAALMSIAGPASNFLLAALAILGLHVLIWAGLADHGFTSGDLGAGALVAVDRDDTVTLAVASILTLFVFMNVILGIFNLLPWPPLDGAGVVEGVAPRSRGLYGFVRSQPILMIVGMLGIWQILPELFAPVWDVITNWM